MAIFQKKYRKIINFNIFYLFVFFSVSCHNKEKFIKVKTNFLKIKNEIVIPLNSNTLAYSKNIHFKDSVLMIFNENLNTITCLNLEGKVLNYLDFISIENKRFLFKISSAWLKNIDTIFIYSEDNHKIYFVNKATQIFDSLNLATNYKKTKIEDFSYPQITSIQMPLFSEGKSFYLNSFNNGEDSVRDFVPQRFVISNYTENILVNYVNFPNEYNNQNWGGYYFRMIYNCIVNDSLIYISFPASSEIAIFNIKSKKTSYKKLYPDMSNIIKPINDTIFRFSKGRKNLVSEHFFGQYSFRAIIYDKYRKLFYRILLEPISDDKLTKNHSGLQKKILLVYDENLMYLGCNELDETYSDFTYFVNEKGLYIQKITKNEKNIYFDLFVDSSNK